MTGPTPAGASEQTRAAVQQIRRRRRRHTATASGLIPQQPTTAPAAPVVKRGAGRATLAALTGRMTRAEIAAGITSAATTLVPVDSRGRRWALYNGSAAGAGHVAIYGFTGSWMGAEPLMSAAVHSVPACAAFVITIGAAVGGWRAGRILRGLPGLYGRAASPACMLAAASWGQGTEPLVADVLAATAPWSTILLPLIAAAGLAGACWWLLDSRVTGWLSEPRWAPVRTPIRWAARIPLATLALGAGLYAPGAVL